MCLDLLRRRETLGNVKPTQPGNGLCHNTAACRGSEEKQGAVCIPAGAELHQNNWDSYTRIPAMCYLTVGCVSCRKLKDTQPSDSVLFFYWTLYFKPMNKDICMYIHIYIYISAFD